MANDTEKTYYVLDLTFAAKARVLAYTGLASSTAAVGGKVAGDGIVWAVSLAIALPEFTSTLIGLIAFAHMAKAASEDYSANLIHPGDVTIREMKPPRIQL